jgi:septal ring factor EnvC (AmiA/AmiB activator)
MFLTCSLFVFFVSCHQEMEVVANAEEHRVKILVEQFKERSNMTTVQAEAKLNEYREKIKSITDRNRDLDTAVRGLEQDKKSVSYKLEEARHTISRLQDQSREFEAEVADLTSQLASSLEARERSAKKAAHRLYEEDENIDENYDVDSILHELGEE